MRPTPRFTALDPGFFKRDGHCSYSADGRWMLYDSYPDAQRRQGLWVYDLRQRQPRELGQFLSPKVPVIDIRCDLHPRWLPDGRVSFDSTHEEFRGLYVAERGR
jgi:Tol biopolymer transport system component